MNTEKDKPKVLRGYLNYKDLYFYQKIYPQGSRKGETA